MERDPADAARESAAALRARGAEIVVALVHAGLPAENRRLVAAVTGIDWAVLGHSALNLESPEPSGGARLLEAQSEGKNLGRLDLHLVGGARTFVDRGARAEIASILNDHRRQLHDDDHTLGELDPATAEAYYQQRRQELRGGDHPRNRASGPAACRAHRELVREPHHPARSKHPRRSGGGGPDPRLSGEGAGRKAPASSIVRAMRHEDPRRRPTRSMARLLAFSLAWVALTTGGGARGEHAAGCRTKRGQRLLRDARARRGEDTGRGDDEGAVHQIRAAATCASSIASRCRSTTTYLGSKKLPQQKFIAESNDPAAIEVSGYDGAAKGYHLSLAGCIACSEPMPIGSHREPRFVTLAKPDKSAAWKLAAGVPVSKSTVAFDDFAAAKHWAEMEKPFLRAEFLFQPQAEGSDFTVGMAPGISLMLVGARVFNRCTGEILVSEVVVDGVRRSPAAWPRGSRLQPRGSAAADVRRGGLAADRRPEELPRPPSTT